MTEGPSMVPTTTASSYKGRSSHESILFRLNNWWYVFLGKMQVLDYILAMTKSTTTDKVRYMSYGLILLGSSFCLQNQLRVFIRYGTWKRSLVSEKNQTSCQTNMSPYRSISNVTNNKHELWKPVRLTSFQKRQLQFVSIFKFIHPCLVLYLMCYSYLLLTFWAFIFVSLNLVAVFSI